MPRLRSTRLESPTARLKLPIRRLPHAGPSLARGIQLLYRRNKGGGSWVVKVADGAGGYWTMRVAIADDYEPANSDSVLDFHGASEAALRIARRGTNADAAADAKPVTVADALDAYQRDLEARGADPSNARRARRHLIGTALAGKPVALIGANELRQWRDGLIAKGMKPGTVNRTRGPFRAALELAASLDQRIANQRAYKVGLKGVPGGKNARRVVLPDADVLRIVAAAYEHDHAFGLLVEVLAQTGARISQVARLSCRDLQADGPDPRLMMPTSYKGRGEKERQHTAVPVSLAFAALLKEARGDRPPDAPLLVKSNGERWLGPNRRKSEHWPIFRLVAERAGCDPDEITSYALRHSSICRALLRNIPVSIVAKLHDTSSREIESHYAAHILDVAGDALSRRGLLQPEPLGGNVVALVK